MFGKASLFLVIIALFTFTVPAAMATTTKCTVTEIKDTVVILDCSKGTGKMKQGDKVKVKTIKKKAIEGC